MSENTDQDLPPLMDAGDTDFIGESKPFLKCAPCDFPVEFKRLDRTFRCPVCGLVRGYNEAIRAFRDGDGGESVARKAIEVLDKIPPELRPDLGSKDFRELLDVISVFVPDDRE
ncbi:MAG: hypothetical protein F4Y86_13220 [Gammaproteobacteria bacterium]|nr:hypothetical protein [Gammaproteobacteria bacterium]